MKTMRSSKTRTNVFVVCCVSILVIYCVNQYTKIKELKRNLVKTLENEEKIEETSYFMKENMSSYEVFQSYDAEEFPTVLNGPTRIPHIIHQICHSEDIYEIFQDPISSFVENNPTWEYRFWTYESGRKFLNRHYPYLISIYDAFGGNDVRKSDLLRFAVIHHYGGLYADLDVKNWRSLDIATIKYACIVPTEPFEHSAFIYKTEFILTTAVLLCRPKHPFFKQALINLQLANKDGHPVYVTGPLYFTDIYKNYNSISEDDYGRRKLDNSSNSPYFYRGTLPEDHNDAVYVPNSQYFMGDIDVNLFDSTSPQQSFKICNEPNEFALSGKDLQLTNRACHEFEKRKQLRKERKFTFTSHYWYHMWTFPEAKLFNLKRIHIKTFIPSCVLYK